MQPFKDEEIAPGLVIHLNPQAVRDDPRTECNAKLIDSGYDRSVDEDHYFIVLRRFDVKRWLLIPVFSDSGDADREKLDPGLKTGLATDWTNIDSYVFKWQHWLCPISAILDGAGKDATDESNRRRYAADQLNTLDRLAGLITRNRTYFHKPNPRPLKSSN